MAVVRTRTHLVACFAAVIAAGALLLSGMLFSGLNAETVTADAQNPEQDRRKAMPWIPLLLLGDSDEQTIIRDGHVVYHGDLYKAWSDELFVNELDGSNQRKLSGTMVSGG